MAERANAITIDENGTPLIAGTNVPVQQLLEHLQAGGTLTAFGDQHPEVDPDTAVQVMELAWETLSGGEGENRQ
jgi:uncharacterized protein (DUF433 family)